MNTRIIEDEQRNQSHLANGTVDGHLDRALEGWVGVERGELRVECDVGEDARQNVLDVGTKNALGVRGTRGA